MKYFAALVLQLFALPAFAHHDHATGVLHSSSSTAVWFVLVAMLLMVCVVALRSVTSKV